MSHAIIEQVNADLKNSALARLPSGHFAAHRAWAVGRCSLVGRAEVAIRAATLISVCRIAAVVALLNRPTALLAAARVS
jgi:hypothetical protein